VIPGSVIGEPPPDPSPPPEPSGPLGLPATERPAHARAAASGDGDPLDKIAKLAQLRDSGALTAEEFEREKAKLLAQM
jgi:putative oligomerization/nucleic acid binding protein